MHGVIETAAFKKDADSSGMTEDIRHDIAAAVGKDPKMGDLMPGTGGCRKFRWAMPGRGKRGSWRIVTYFAAEDVPVFLLNVISKGERSDLS